MKTNKNNTKTTFENYFFNIDCVSKILAEDRVYSIVKQLNVLLGKQRVSNHTRDTFKNALS